MEIEYNCSNPTRSILFLTNFSPPPHLAILYPLPSSSSSVSYLETTIIMHLSIGPFHPQFHSKRNKEDD